jgi:hypothetical protein
MPAPAITLNALRVRHALANPAAVALAVIAVSTMLKLVLCPFVGLGVNESYAIASGRLLSLSYFDHPPLHFWLAYLSELTFGYTPFARIPFILLGAATSWLMFLLARELFGAAAAVWSVGVLNLSIFFSLMSGNWILPDGPLNFFLLATALALSPIALGRHVGLARWVIAGAFAGLAAISKYHAFLFVAGFFGFLLASPTREKVLAEPGPWCSAMVMLLIFSPVLFWNAQHNWISIKFQGGRAIPHGLAIGKFLSLAGAQIVVLLPALPIPLFAGIRESFSKPDVRRNYLLWLGLPICAVFTFVPLITHSGMLHWAMPGWLLLIPLGGAWLAENDKIAQNIIRISTILFLIFAAIGVTEFQTGAIGRGFPKALRHGAPTSENASWEILAHTVTGDPARTVIITDNWRDAAKIDQGLSGEYRVMVASDDPRNFAVGLQAKQYNGESGWIVVRRKASVNKMAAFSHCFKDIFPAGLARITLGSSVVAELYIAHGLDFRTSACAMRTF